MLYKEKRATRCEVYTADTGPAVDHKKAAPLAGEKGGRSCVRTYSVKYATPPSMSGW